VGVELGEVSDAEWDGDLEAMTEFRRARMKVKWPVPEREIVLPNLHTLEIYRSVYILVS